MQTFLPFESFERSMLCLDKRRCWKQVVEADQILDVLLDRPTKSGKPRSGWRSHPAVQMWRGFEAALAEYRNKGLAVCVEVHSIKTSKSTIDVSQLAGEQGLTMPPWLGYQAMHVSHQSNLLRKDFDFYRGSFEGFLDPTLPYVWPSKMPEFQSNAKA